MNEKELNQLRYPIGKFVSPSKITKEMLNGYIKTLDEAPGKYRAAIKNLTDEQLDTQYRPGGWTIRQVIHHVPDSHINSYVRFKLGLTEDNPTIKTYNEAKWAEISDSKDTPVEISLLLFESLHKRWVVMLKAMSQNDFAKTVNHPEWGKIRLDKMLAIYDWHCEHHLAHILSLKKRMGW